MLWLLYFFLKCWIRLYKVLSLHGVFLCITMQYLYICHLGYSIFFFIMGKLKVLLLTLWLWSVYSFVQSKWVQSIISFLIFEWIKSLLEVHQNLTILWFVCLDSLKADDVGLSPELPYFRLIRNGRSPIITYLHLYECDKFSVCFFLSLRLI